MFQDGIVTSLMCLVVIIVQYMIIMVKEHLHMSVLVLCVPRKAFDLQLANSHENTDVYTIIVRYSDGMYVYTYLLYMVLYNG